MILDEENKERIKDLISQITKKQIAFVLAGTVALSSLVVIEKHKKDDNKNSNKIHTLYLMEIKNIEELELYTNQKETIETKIEITDKMYVITDKEKTFINKLYKSYIVNSKGEMQECYLKGKNIALDVILDEINIPEDLKYRSELDIVTPKDGSWMRKNKIIDRNTDNARLLESGTYVIASMIDSTSKENDYYWKEAICVDIDNRSFYKGFMMDGYLMNSDFKNAEGIKFETNGQLNIRDNPSINGNVITQLEKETEVVLIPNLPSTTADNIDWFYVAYKKNEKINFGYCAATEYRPDGTEIKYLTETDKSFLKEKKYAKKRIDFSKYNENDEKMIGKVVSLQGEAEHLNLRKKPGLNGTITHYLEEGTYIYTYSSELEKTVSKDGYKWIKIYLIDGTEGYVAQKYLKDYDQNIDNDEYSINSENINTYTFNNMQVNGYFGIDINNTTDPSVFEKTITNDNYYEDDYPQMNQRKKIDFAIIKLGATANGWGPFQIIDQTDSILGNLNSLLNVCEKNKTPYGMYYYTQATTKEEADCEVETIVNLLTTLGIKSKNYMQLPLYIDIECFGYDYGQSYNARVLESALENGKSYQTEILNYVMNKVRERTGLEVCLYTDHNTMNSTINFDELEEINKTNCWIVEVNETHSNNLITYEPSVYNYTNTWQTEVDKSIYIDETGDIIATDFDIMNEEYYNQHVR